MIRRRYSSIGKWNASPRLRRPALAFALGCLASTLACAAHANTYTVLATAANLTNVAADGKCNLTEAIQSAQQGPVNSDCVPQSSSVSKVILSGANTTFQVAAGTTTFMDMTLTTSSAGVVIEAAGTPFKVIDGSLLTLTGPSGGMTIRVKSGSAGRALYNGGDVIGTKVTFQGANVSGLSGDADGGVIYNWGNLNLTECTLQGGTAVNGGGLYNRTPWVTLLHVTIQNNQATQSGGGIYNAFGDDVITAMRCPIQNNTATVRGGGAYNNGWLKLYHSAVKGNKAGQGGGIYHAKPGSMQPELGLFNSTVSDNKAISNELTPVPGPSGTSITSVNNSCSQTETPSQAFDGDFATKWCNSAAAAPTYGSPAIITYTFPAGAPQVVSAYSLTSANDVPGRDPMDWTFEANTGFGWITLQVVTGFTFAGATFGQRYLTESFNAESVSPQYQFNNSTAYSAYRLVINRNSGNLPITQLGEIQFFTKGRTGDGGGIYTLSHMNIFNSTLSGNIAGCTNASCACTAAFCATTSNTSPTQGKGGGLYAGNPPPEALQYFVTVAGNSASQGGGVYADHFDHWGWSWCLIGKNAARTNRVPEPDFHGSPHAFFERHEVLVQNTTGTTGLSPGGFGGDVVADPQLEVLADNGGEFPELHPGTHALKANSPAKETAPSNTDFATDERGVTRPQGTYRDLGAYELK
ncbi:MAG: coagulation factor 5/8 type domain protein [Fibrobacteres bacterium]|nr:coagulation factor 5/8 type domain protein [Fibrobacterota bacterium]